MSKKASKKGSLWKKAVITIGAIGIVAGSATVAKRVIDPGERVIEVIDGDTFTISNKQSIRLYNIDAPELQYCFGKEAKKALTDKILGKKVILKSPRMDYYKRVQAYVYIVDGKTLEGESINEYMVKNGFAKEHADNTPESNIISKSDIFARENKLGIFSSECTPLVPTKVGCTIKGQVSYDTNERIYITPDCEDQYNPAIVERYRGEDWFCTEKEAKEAGFIKSPNCQ